MNGWDSIKEGGSITTDILWAQKGFVICIECIRGIAIVHGGYAGTVEERMNK
jgi:hypothetical protein